MKNPLLYTIILLLLILGAGLSCGNQHKCNSFKNGRFTMVSELTGSGYVFNRKDSLQIETDVVSGRRTEWKITWLNNCAYNLVLLNDSKPKTDTSSSYKPLSLTFDIISTTKKYYIFRCQKPVWSDTIWVAK